MRILFLLPFIPLILASFELRAQQDTVPSVIIKGRATESSTGYGLPGLMVVNKRTHRGLFGDHAGNFQITALKTDTIKFSVIGFSMIEVCFKDSAFKEVYTLQLEFDEIKMELDHVEIFPQRDFSEIKKDIEDLGVKHKYQTEGIGGLSSPITFLYERFSRFEKQKRLAAELYNEEAKKDILKELFRKYVKADIIDLSEKEFEEFIYYCNIPESFIKNATQYELVMSVKHCFEYYMRYRKQNPENSHPAGVPVRNKED